MKGNIFSIMPVGGVGEIGSNMTVLKTPDYDIIIDCGLLFPYENFFDINYLIPNVDSLEPARLKALIITHGHEDHIGAVSHFVERFPRVPIFASSFTRDLIKRKTEERGLTPLFELYTKDSVLEFDDLNLFPIQVTHSIPDTFGFFITNQNKDWGAFYVSDFKFDLLAKHEAPFDIQKLVALAKSCKKTAYFIDSTNALVEGKTPSENDLIPALEDLVLCHSERLFVTLFASNIHRIYTICRLAKKHNRKIVLMGRSLESYIRCALEHGLMGDFTETDFCTPVQVKDQSSRLLVLVSGCQGDFHSALRRLSFGEDAIFKLRSDDCVAFSSKVIPGNEKQISRIINRISESGAKVITAYDSHIHASGHPAKEDLRELLSFHFPDVYLPIHGESFFLKRHSEWIKTQSSSVETEVILNWSEVIFKDNLVWKVAKHTPLEPILIHGNGLPIERTQIAQRRKMACQGSVFISLDRVRGLLEVSSHGLPLSAELLMPKLKSLILDKVRSDLSGRQIDYTKDQIRIATRQFYQSNLGYKPVTSVHILS